MLKGTDRSIVPAEEDYEQLFHDSWALVADQGTWSLISSPTPIHPDVPGPIVSPVCATGVVTRGAQVGTI